MGRCGAGGTQSNKGKWDLRSKSTIFSYLNLKQKQYIAASEIWKSDKTTQNVPKTVDNH